MEKKMKVRDVNEKLVCCQLRLMLSGSQDEFGDFVVLAGPASHFADEFHKYYHYNVDHMTVSADCYDCLELYISPA